MGFSDLFAEKFSAALLADAAFRSGVNVGLPAPGLRPLDVHSKLAGPAITVEANNDLVSILEVVHLAKPNDVVVVSNQHQDAGLMGDLIGTEAIRKGLAGFVVDGLVRDALELIGLGLPVFSRGSYPVGPLKISTGERSNGVVEETISIGGATVEPGMWVFGDADGLIILEEDTLEAVFHHAATVMSQEEALTQEIASGTALADAFELDAFLAKRGADPQTDFNSHLKEINRAI